MNILYTIIIFMIISFNCTSVNAIHENNSPPDIPNNQKVCLFHGNVYEIIDPLSYCSNSAGHNHPQAHDPDIDSDDPECFTSFIWNFSTLFI